MKRERQSKCVRTHVHNIVLKNISMYIKKLNNNLRKLHKYQDNITYGLNYLFNDVNENDYHNSQEIKSAFDGNYVLYEKQRR